MTTKGINNQVNNKRTTDEQQVNTNNNVNKVNNDNNENNNLQESCKDDLRNPTLF